MREFTDAELVCLYLDACEGGIEESPTTRRRAAVGIAEALELGNTTASRIGLLEELGELEAEGLVESAERPVVGYESPRTVYGVTEAGERRAERLRDAVVEETVVLTNGTSEEVPLSAVGRYFEEKPAPVVTALTRRTADGEVPLDRHEGEDFVDRTAQLATVTDAIEDSFTERSRTVTVGAPSGMGKTALVREAIDRVREDNPDLLVAGGASSAGATDPYAAFEQAFGALPETSEVPALLADARERVSPADPQRAESQREALFADIADGLRSVTTDQPVVVRLENLQWAGEATRALFAYLATDIDELVYPIAFVGTYRRPAVAATDDHPLPATFDQIDREGRYTDLELEALSRPDTRTLVAEVVGRYQVPDAFVDLIYERTGGNPLFVRETALHLLETGRIDPGADHYPTTADALELPGEVTTQIERRLESLDEGSRALLRQAAVLGERVPEPVLAAMSDLPAPRRREYADVLVGSRIWEPVTDQTAESELGTAVRLDGGGDVQFVSGGLREAVVERLPDSLTERYHRQAANALLAVYGDDAAEYAARVAHHFENADEPAEAVEYYRRAGDDAQEAYAYEDAIGHYERALELATDADDAGEKRLAELHLDVADVYEKLGQFDNRLAAARAGLERAPADAPVTGTLHGVVADVHVKRGDYDEGKAAAARQRDLGERIDDPEQVAGGNMELGRVAMERGEYDRAREYFEETIAINRERGERLPVAHAFQNLGGVEYYQGNREAARDCFERSLAIKREVGDRWEQTSTLNNLGVLLRDEGKHDRAREYLERCRDICEDVGDRHRLTHCKENIGKIHYREGDIERARECFEETLALKRDIGAKRGEAIALANLGDVAITRGAYDEARERYEQSLEIRTQMGNDRGAAISHVRLGKIAHRRGKEKRARERLEEGLAVLPEGAHPRLRSEANVSLADIARERDDLGTASDRVERALEAAEDADSRHARARALAARARLALTRDDPERARETAGEARELAEAVDRPLGTARVRRLCGRVAREIDGPGAAREQLHTALETFAGAGADDEALLTLELLVEYCRAAGERERAAEYRQRARELLAGAPDPTATKHRQWVEENDDGS